MLLCFGCCDSEPNGFTKPEIYKGSITATINGVNWVACPYAIDGALLGILSDYFDEPSGRIEQSLSIHLPATTGNFGFSHMVDSIGGKAYILFAYVDDDVTLAYYDIPIGKENGEVSITFYSETERRITDNFNATLFLSSNSGLETPPDSLVITNGQFETWFID